MAIKKNIFLFWIIIVFLGCTKEDFLWDLKKVNRLPTISTINVSNITNTGVSVISEIKFDGGSTVTKRGVCWGTFQNPTILDNITSNGSGTGEFKSSISVLNSNTTYYVRAYATNAVGTSYGNQIIFTTTNISGSLPTLTTIIASNVTNNSAVTGGNITSDGGSIINQRGVCWGNNQNPTISDNITSNGTGTGSFISPISGLNSNTTYYLRAYATNAVGTSYGNQIIFTTTNNNLSLASLITSPVNSITQTSAKIGGNITNDGGSSVISRGVCYSNSQNPTTSNSIVNSGSGVGSFTTNISNLLPNTTYYVRAFAINSIGTSYGNQITFSTNQLPNINCNIIGITTGTNFTMQTSFQSYYTQGNSYTITMYSPVYSFGQANSVALYDGDVFIYSFGSWLVFTNNTRTFTLPGSIPASNCYNIRVIKGSDLYVSPTFIIVP